ncbi:MAG: protein-glutamate O-methyltransferase CheR [Acidobacteriota bacterium]|jgi:chemotaxis methyl-accepting protein methylase
MPTNPSPARPGAPEEVTLSRIAASVRRQRGLDLVRYKAGFLRRRIGVRQRALGLPSLADYADALRRDPAELDRLLRSLTINVSEFFRNPTLFRLLQRRVLPSLLEEAAGQARPLTAWSAGCAGGEELYSLAIVLAEMGTPPAAASLLGTDIDREAVAAAREGTFEDGRMRELPAALRARYFEPGPRPRTRRIRTQGLPAVRFRSHDLLAAPLRRGLDLILCRNVLIYFELELQDAILDRIAGALRPGGVLVLGRVERLAGGLRHLFEPLDLRERVYRKTCTGASHAG